VKPDETEKNMQQLKAIIRRIGDLVETPEYKAVAAQMAIEAASFERTQAELRRKLQLEGAGVLPRYWSILDNPRPSVALAAVEELLRGPPTRTFVVLAGPAGRGKTAALSIGTWRRGGYYYDAQELLRESTFDSGLWSRLEAAPFLALDELGAESINPAWEANLYDLLNARDARLRKTAIATNLNAAAFRERYATAGLQRLLDRINTAGDFMVLPGESMRRHWSDTEGE
jgi:DNA replication protein DnaC